MGKAIHYLGAVAVVVVGVWFATSGIISNPLAKKSA
jgi:hypothetical protein